MAAKLYLSCFIFCGFHTVAMAQAVLDDRVLIPGLNTSAFQQNQNVTVIVRPRTSMQIEGISRLITQGNASVLVDSGPTKYKVLQASPDAVRGMARTMVLGADVKQFLPPSSFSRLMQAENSLNAPVIDDSKHIIRSFDFFKQEIATADFLQTINEESISREKIIPKMISENFDVNDFFVPYVPDNESLILSQYWTKGGVISAVPSSEVPDSVKNFYGSIGLENQEVFTLPSPDSLSSLIADATSLSAIENEAPELYHNLTSFNFSVAGQSVRSDSLTVQTVNPEDGPPQINVNAFLEGGGTLSMTGSGSTFSAGSLSTSNEQFMMVPTPGENGATFYSFVKIGEMTSTDLVEEDDLPEDQNFGADALDDAVVDLPIGPPQLIDVLVAFTQEAADRATKESGNSSFLESFAGAEIAKTNAFDPTNQVVFRLAATTVFDLEQPDKNVSFKELLNSFLDGTNTHADALTRMADTVGSDISVIAIYLPDSRFCGRASAFRAAKDSSLIVWNIAPKCMVRHSLAHEIAHLFGAVHDDHPADFPYQPSGPAFGFHAPMTCFTILAKMPNCKGCTRFGWSNPRAKFPQADNCNPQEMGTYERSDVLRFLIEQASIFASYRSLQQ